MRVPSTERSAGSNVIAASTDTDGDQHAADPDRADERQRQDHHREQSDRDGRAGNDHRASRVGHGLDERRLDVLALAQLVSEAEDHQQRVVDRDAETDERDQELHDDRHVRDVSQRPDEAERVQDRGDRDHDRHQHGGQRAEHEEQDHERAEAADQSLGENARAGAAAGCFILNRIAPREVDRDAGRGRRLQCGPRRIDEVDLAEVRYSARVDRGERRVPVLRNVGVAARREVGADPRLGICRLRFVDRVRDPALLRDVARAVEDGDHRRLCAAAEDVQRPLICLVGRSAGDRELRQPALRDLAGREGAEDRQHDPHADHEPAAADDQMGETLEHSWAP